MCAIAVCLLVSCLTIYHKIVFFPLFLAQKQCPPPHNLWQIKNLKILIGNEKYACKLWNTGPDKVSNVCVHCSCVSCVVLLWSPISYSFWNSLRWKSSTWGNFHVKFIESKNTTYNNNSLLLTVYFIWTDPKWLLD